MTYDYEIEDRSEELGGGWKLKLLENNEEVGGGVFEEKGHAEKEAKDWIRSRPT